MSNKLNTDKWSVVNKNYHHGYYIENEVGETVCDLYFKTSLNEVCEHGFMAKEHAHLIAAAPEMYEALANLIERLKDEYLDSGENPNDDIDLLKANYALAKARGEQ